MRTSVPSNADIQRFAGGRPNFPASPFGATNESSFPTSPFGATNRFNQGLEALGPVGNKSQADSNSIRTITHNLLLAGLPDESEKELRKGDTVMVTRSGDYRDSRVVAVDISYFNQRAREEFRTNSEALLSSGTGRSAQGPFSDERGHAGSGRTPDFDMARLPEDRQAGALYGETMYTPRTRVMEQRDEYRARGLDKSTSKSVLLREYMDREKQKSNGQGEGDAMNWEEVETRIRELEVQEAARASVLDVFHDYRDSHGRYLTLDGIMSNWNILAPLNNSSFADGDKVRSSNGTPSIVLAMARYAHVSNRWSAKVRQGAILGYILKQLVNKDAEGKAYAEFARVPYYSNAREYPSAKDLEYRGIDGAIEYGHFFMLGTADNLAKNQPSEHTCRAAMGLDNTNYAEAREKNGTLNTIQVLVRHRF